jgi:bifunctional non-homologous end joining protein LigD
MSLRTYQAKRDFSKTREPRGAAPSRAAGTGHAYLIQKHAARRLHYDLRLQIGDTLKSWAVTKGPSLRPGDRRLAVHVEDHPLEYGSFEGTIPKGEYGGGTVLLWDRGRWEAVGDAEAGYREGKLKFRLHGEKLHGGWMLVRLKPRSPRDRDNWLLIKERDDDARDAGDVLADQPDSVKTGRSLEQIARAEDAVWRSNRTGNGAAKPKAKAKAKATAKTATPRDDATVAGVRISHPDRVLLTGDGVTKLALARYYEAIAPRLLPELVDRPLSLLRCPGDGEQGCFFQKHIKDGMSKALRQIPVKEKDGTALYVGIDDVEGLIGLVQFGVIEFHPWGSRAGDLERPDRLIFDLDPDPALPFKAVAAAARELRERLATLELRSFLKTTGGKGLHVVVPLTPAADWDAAKAFARGVAEAMVADAPDAYVATMAKAKRTGKIFIDFFRNDRGATAVAAYSVRARPGAPVATPLAWDELTARMRGDRFTVMNLARRIAAQHADPWADIFKVKQKLPTSGAPKKVRRRSTAS